MAKNQALGTVLFLVCSGAAFAAAIYIETAPAWAGVVGGDKKADEASAPASKAPAPPPPSKRRAAPPAGTGSSRGKSLSLSETIAEPTPAGSALAPAAPALSVPDFKGKRLSIARREARALGIVILARNDEGQRVSGEVAPYYRVRRQLTLAGAAVEPGATVEVRVREAETPSGY